MKYRRAESDEPSSDEYVTTLKKRGSKRRRTLTKSEPQDDEFSLTPLLQLAGSEKDDDETFEDVMTPELLSDFLSARQIHLESLFETDSLGQLVRPLSLSEKSALLQNLQTRVDAGQNNSTDQLLLLKLKLDKHRVEHGIRVPNLLSHIGPTLQPLPEDPATIAPEPSILSALNAIGSTPFSSSLAARSSGPIPHDKPAVLLRDWEARPHWIDVMDDIRDHHVLLHPDEEWEERTPAPIDYQALRPEHMYQVHDLLGRLFWPGIDVHDALDFSPEKCTVVATYKKLVVGVAFFSSPEELYITYLAVRAGWESSQIATKMLYTLLTRNPSRDILLHVSASNPAMLLYNRFGFKAEEFIVGFYDDYLDRESRESKNAFRLRLRR